MNYELFRNFVVQRRQQHQTAKHSPHKTDRIGPIQMQRYNFFNDLQ